MFQESDHAWLSPLELNQILCLVSYQNRYMSNQSDDRIYMPDKRWIRCARQSLLALR